MDLVVAPRADGYAVAALDGGGEPTETQELTPAGLADLVRRGGDSLRLVWSDAASVYPPLLAVGVRVRRAADLGLQRAILRNAAAVAHTPYAQTPPSVWDERHETARWAPAPTVDRGATLFDLTGGGPGLEECLAEHRAQRECLAAARDRGGLALLSYAESVGGLIAQELNHTGVPFSEATHDAQLRALLGEPPAHGGRPARMAHLAARIQELLEAPQLNPDSATTLVTALRRAGLDVRSTRKWELRRLDHPVIEPLLEYKALSRLHTANGWAWMQHWVRDGRFLPDWVPAGVVTGRWASRGGGALQLPKQIRAAVRADPGWRLVVADASQLEPRVLAAMAGDAAMARAARAGDLYQALVDQGVLSSREHAKIAMLGAMYGATSGEAGELMPRLRAAYPQAIGWVDAAARAGERGERVSTWLGRTSPRPPGHWYAAQEAARAPGESEEAGRRGRSMAREWGRFTRNFVVQGTAAEWALCWMGHLRRALDDAPQTGAGRPELVYFLHDEVMVHVPAEQAEAVAEQVRRTARAAGELLFPGSEVDFPVTVAVVDSYDQAG